MAALLALSTTLLASALVSLAQAGGPRVVLLGPSAEHPTVVRMRDELRLLGLEIEVVAPAPADADLGAVARGRTASAVARVQDQPPEILLWVALASQGDAGTTELRVSDSLDGPVEPALRALWAIELPRGTPTPAPRGGGGGGGAGGGARASTGDAAAARPPPPLPPPAAPRSGSRPRPAVAERAAPVEPRPWALIVGPAVALSPGGVPAAPEVRIGAEWSPLARVALTALASIPTTAADVGAPEGTVHVRALTLGGGAEVALDDPRSTIVLAAGAGMGAMLLDYSADAVAPWVAASGGAWVASPYLTAAATYRLHPAFGLRLEALGALALAEPVVRVAGREVAAFGRPAVIVSLGAEVRP